VPKSWPPTATRVRIAMGKREATIPTVTIIETVVAIIMMILAIN
jgi:hypothetical protein